MTKTIITTLVTGSLIAFCVSRSAADELLTRDPSSFDPGRGTSELALDDGIVAPSLEDIRREEEATPATRAPRPVPEEPDFAALEYASRDEMLDTIRRLYSIPPGREISLSRGEVEGKEVIRITVSPPPALP